MKNVKLIIAIVFILASIVPQIGFGQKFYIKAFLGGGVGINGSEFNMNSYAYTDSTSSIYNSKVKFLSIRNGFYPGISIGRDFGKHFSLELNVLYFYRIPTILNTTDYYNISGHEIKAENVYKYKGHEFCFIPAFKISPGFEKFDPYIKVGFILATGSLKEEDSTLFTGTSIPPQGYKQKWTHHASLYYGLKTAIGFDYPIAKRVKIFVEVAYDNLAFSPSKSTLTEYTSKGVNLMGGLTVSDKEIVYVDEITPNVAPDPYKPYPVLKEKFSYNTLSISVGFEFQ
jgi:hypothetical protein